MPDPQDTLDLSCRPAVPASSVSPAGTVPSVQGGAAGRRYLRLWFRCANAYARAYRTPNGNAYLGRCPRCGKTVRFGIGPAGTTRRLFEVTCAGR